MPYGFKIHVELKVVVPVTEKVGSSYMKLKYLKVLILLRK